MVDMRPGFLFGPGLLCFWLFFAQWFSLHSKFIFLEGCRVTSRFWAENVNKTNKKGVYSTRLFEGCRLNDFVRVTTWHLIGVTHLLGKAVK